MTDYALRDNLAFPISQYLVFSSTLAGIQSSFRRWYEKVASSYSTLLEGAFANQPESVRSVFGCSLYMFSPKRKPAWPRLRSRGHASSCVSRARIRIVPAQGKSVLRCKLSTETRYDPRRSHPRRARSRQRCSGGRCGDSVRGHRKTCVKRRVVSRFFPCMILRARNQSATLP